MISPNAKIGKNTKIYDQNLSYIEECEIGENCKIHPFVTIQDNVKVGNFCKIEHYVFIPSSVEIEDEVFVGQGVKFTNDKYPRATIDGRLKKNGDYKELSTIVKKGVSIGSNSTILCGITIGEGSLIGAGSVVTKDVPPHTLVIGNPARVVKNLK
ncbi:MAG: N-acetyltransferase [Actinobacteria bacterium]|nr:N-acetyltransferase [Actinomycetota bacterium]